MEYREERSNGVRDVDEGDCGIESRIVKQLLAAETPRSVREVREKERVSRETEEDEGRMSKPDEARAVKRDRSTDGLSG